MIDLIKRVVADFMAGFSPTRYGTVSGYNPNDYTVKVILQPEGVETGFVPLAAAWVGSNLGAVFGPAIGDEVRLDFIDGNAQATVVGGRFFSVSARPPVVQSGQAAIVDGQGAYVRLNNDGTITIGAPTGITSTTPLLKQVGNLEVDGSVTVTQSITATQNISDQGGAHGSLQTLRNAHNGHSHTDPQGGTTGLPSITA